MRSKQQDRAIPRVGEWLECTYPVCNRIGVPIETRTRIFCVLAVRDLRKHPLKPETLIKNELARRSRYLLDVWDELEGEIRRVYHGSLDATVPNVAHTRIDCGGKRIHRAGPSPRDLRIASGALKELRNEEFFDDITFRPEW